MHNASWSYSALTPLFTFILGALITSTAHLYVLLLQHYLFHSFMYLFIVTTESSWSCPYARKHDWCCRIPYFDVNTGRPGSSHCLFLQQMFTVLFVFPPLKINSSQKFLSLCFSFKFLIENVFLVIFCWWFSLSHLLDFPHPPYPSNSMSLSLSL